ncbi:MAG: hypothetical protein NTU89_01080 [Candidatus Dependentiae bacterium]|nr:hypothetical protein [Candidatus Dependentiae bacterium]
MNLLKFYINSSEKEFISIDEDISEITLFENIKINFEGVNKYILINDCFDYTIDVLKNMLKEAINNKLPLHKSLINKNKNSLIGYQWSQYLQKRKRKSLVYDRTRGGIQWVGYLHNLFETSHGIDRPASWLYNDEHGNIILEITPVYPWFSSKPEAGETFVKYSEWMKSYKPLLIRTISKETAQQWLKQIDELIEVVKANDERTKCTGLGCLHCAKEGKTGCPCGS